MIINLTQHTATPAQIAAGVIDFPEAQRPTLLALLTFEAAPTHEEMSERALSIRDLLRGHPTVAALVEREDRAYAAWSEAHSCAHCHQRLRASHPDPMPPRERVGVMIGCAPFFQEALVRLLTGHGCGDPSRGYVPVFAFSVRRSTDATQPDGSTRKVSIFEHAGFIAASKFDAAVIEWTSAAVQAKEAARCATL